MQSPECHTTVKLMQVVLKHEGNAKKDSSIQESIDNIDISSSRVVADTKIVSRLDTYLGRIDFIVLSGPGWSC